MKGKKNYVIGVDFGTSSVRAVLVDTENGHFLSSSEFAYPRWSKMEFCDPSKNQFRQHPKDYLEGLEHVVKDCIASCSAEVVRNISAISIDTTGSTPVAVNEEGIPLSLLPEFEENPNAMFFLWKDHSAVAEAARINDIAQKEFPEILKFSGGIYSSEWFWAKLLYVLRNDEAVGKACASWVEHCDWMPFLLTGQTQVKTMRRSACAAGHKAIWAQQHGGLPSAAFLKKVDPVLERFAGLYTEVHTADESAGTLTEEWANKLGLSEKVMVGVGALDAHMGAVGAMIQPNYLSKVMGTSTCDMLVSQVDAGSNAVKGICGQADGSIIPGMIGMEAGQSAFGDIFSWFTDLLCWNGEHVGQASEERKSAILERLSKAAEKIPVTKNTELAVDWFNGRRTPDANQLLSAGIIGLNLGSDAPSIYRSLAESTCFGARQIVERFRTEGVNIEGVIGSGGVAQKSPFIMQMMADILEMPIRISASQETTALGAAMFAATVAKVYGDVSKAMEKMGSGFSKVYLPDEEKRTIYAARYERYKELAAFLENQVTN